MKKSLFVPVVVIWLFVLNSAFVPAYAVDISTVSSSDTTFVMKAAQGGMTEVQLGELAANKGTSQEVKDFGAKMVVDHGRANDELKSLASSKSIVLPDKLDEKHQALVDKFSNMASTDFDKSYVNLMVTAHKKDDGLFAQEASSGQDSDIKAFAATTDEMVKMHLSMIQDIQSKMK